MLSFFFFNVTPTTEIDTYGHTLSLHAALPISAARAFSDGANEPTKGTAVATPATPPTAQAEATQKRREGSGGRLGSTAAESSSCVVVWLILVSLIHARAGHTIHCF